MLYSYHMWHNSCTHLSDVLTQCLEVPSCCGFSAVLIFGQFGALKCDPKLVAECFKQVINSQRYDKGMKKIVFAIAYDGRKVSIW